MTAMTLMNDALHNPLDVAELVVMDRDWSFDRLGEGELITEAKGVWCSYRMWFTWTEDPGALMLTCSFEARVPKASMNKVHALLNMVNEKLWIGYFVLGTDEPIVMFRHSLMIRDGAGTNAQQIQDLLDTALQESERFYPAFQSVVWSGKTPAEALEIALFETIAEA